MSMFGDFLNKFSFSDKDEERSRSNQIATDSDDGAIQTENIDYLSQYAMSLDWSYTDQVDLINTYREVANYSLVDYAIEDIIGEMVSFDEDENPIELDLGDIDDKELSENIKNKVYEAWDKIYTMLDLKGTIHRRSKQFYVDGRIAYQKVIDQKKPADGLINVIELDTRAITKFRNIEYDKETSTITDIKEFYIYDEDAPKKRGERKKTESHATQKTALKLDPKTVTYVTSGLTDPKTGYAISWLHKAVRPANQLRMMENSLIIYRITRAPERRIFYVDTSGLQKSKAEQYLRRLKNNYRNRMSFDPDSGNFKDTRHLQTMQEDFWLPRNSDGKGTEVSTLPGGQNLSEIDDVLYFQKEMYKSLNIPVSRLDDSSAMPFGRSSEIGRDELKFSKFVSKIRKRFNLMLLDLIKTEVILTRVMTAMEWNKIEQKIKFKYALDMYIEERKQSEMVRDRIELAKEVEDYVGKYVSHQTVRRDILKQTEQDIEDEDKLIEQEKNDPRYKQEEPESNF